VSLVSDVLGESWNLYKTHWRHLLTISFVVYLAVALIGTVLVVLLTWLGFVLAALISLVALLWLQAALVKAVEDVRDGRADLSFEETFEAAQAHLAAVLVAGLIAVIGIGIGLALFIVPGLLLATIWAVIIPAIVVEGRSAGESFGRSLELVRGHFWAVAGLVALLLVVVWGLPRLLDLILQPLADWLQSFVSQIVAGTLTAPFFALVLTVLYFRLVSAKAPVVAPPPAASAAGEPHAEAPPEEPPPASPA